MAAKHPIVRRLISISRKLAQQVDQIRFADPVAYVYNPIVYARRSHERYLDLAGHAFATGKARAVLLGMNPGPWGMAQTGVPFGEVSRVRDWLGIDETVGKPKKEHPKRPITGFACTRSEVSGRRIYEWAEEDFTTAQNFFSHFFIANYCPLSFMEEAGKNRTPDKLPKEERGALFEVCDQALLKTIEALQPDMVIGIGAFAEACARRVLGPHQVRLGLTFGRILHPSPASPLANKGWADAARKDLARLGLP